MPHTKGPWEYTEFTRPDGEPIVTVEDVAATVAHSAIGGSRAELFGVTLPDLGDDARATVVCYTGNGPNSHNNARLIAASPDLYAACEAAFLVVDQLCVERDDWPAAGNARRLLRDAILKAQEGA